MRNIYKTLCLAAGLVAMTSCSDFLDQTSPSELDNKTTFNNTYYTELTVNKIYGSLTQDQAYSNFMPIIAGLNTDCELVDGLGTDASNTSSERGNMNYNANPGWTQLSRVWDVMYGIIENANLVIDGINNSELIKTKGDDCDMMLRFRAEAKVLRAMIYFDLIRLFGDIPFATGASDSNLENVYVGKTDRDVIMEALIGDLEESIPYLPWAGGTTYTTERVTKGYAHGLLANIALTRAGWFIREAAKEGYVTATENSDPAYPTQRCDDEKRHEMYKLAEEHLAAIINDNTHSMTPTLAGYWNGVNLCELDNTYRENLFEIPMGLNNSSELGYTVGFRVNGAFPGGVSEEHNYGPKGNSSGKLKLTAPYYMSFDAADLRRDLTCALMQIRTKSGVYKEDMLGNAPFAIYCGKWDYRKMKNRKDGWWDAVKASDQKVCSGINVVKMRYPHVLLMYAEVMNELYGSYNTGGEYCSKTAFEALSEIHTRAFNGDKAAAEAHLTKLINEQGFFETIVDENAWELAGEGVRKFDLIRWNLLSAKIDEFKESYRNAVNNGSYPAKIYYKFKEDNFTIDVTTFNYNEPVDAGYFSANFFGRETTDAKQEQLLVNLPSISAGLNRVVKNRYLLPIASTTISTLNGKLHNSYGYSD